MNKEEIAKYIDENLLTKQEAMLVTGQSLTAFDQSVNSGALSPFYDHGQARSRTRLYLREDVEKYASQVIERRRRLQKETWTVTINGIKTEIYDEDSAKSFAINASKKQDKVFIEYFRSKDGQEAFLNPSGYGFTAEDWSDQ